MHWRCHLTEKSFVAFLFRKEQLKSYSVDNFENVSKSSTDMPTIFAQVSRLATPTTPTPDVISACGTNIGRLGSEVFTSPPITFAAGHSRMLKETFSSTVRTTRFQGFVAVSQGLVVCEGTLTLQRISGTTLKKEFVRQGFGDDFSIHFSIGVSLILFFKYLRSPSA